MSAKSTFTPFELLRLPSKTALVEEFEGRKLDQLRTPALILNRTAFTENCNHVAKAVESLGLEFRMHVKSKYLYGLLGPIASVGDGGVGRRAVVGGWRSPRVGKD